ncbi:MAG: DUF4007 family protein [Ruminococcaceae bacterium]|nr:DUF4007 family protein [Oscillospiraceae bacterium]
MTDYIKKVKLKGNESFNIREGWLRKGMRSVKDYPDLFSRSDVMEILGVGSKMVKSIRYWLQATHLCVEQNIGGNHARQQFITEDFGKIIEQYDPFFDDVFTLSLIHYHIVRNKQGLCEIWNIFFNEYDGKDFTRENMYEMCKDYLNKRLEQGVTYSFNSLRDDCASVIRMYQEADHSGDPEDNLGSPLSELGLLKKNNRGNFDKSIPSKDVLDKYAILYVIKQNLEYEKNSVSIDEMWKSPNNIGRVFNLNRSTINEYLDQLRAIGLITINRTAGLDMVYVTTEMSSAEIMKEYYEKLQAR